MGAMNCLAPLNLLLGFGCLKGGNHFRGSLNGSGVSARVGGKGMGVAWVRGEG